MLSRTSLLARHVLPRTSVAVAARALSSEAAAEAANSVTLNFSVPNESIYSGATISQVIIPGVEGEYGITANHVPYIAQMKPGVVQIIFSEGSSDSEKYFVSGGYAVTHANSVTVSSVSFRCFPSHCGIPLRIRFRFLLPLIR
jgi:F-type H+-transporting ATPase subunit delta